ncbi:hypothetical protein TELCIR_08112 [Teladorsagia circumcincta]|uniref:Uncharacterized protein n=1 Tax=Teladorsagia circumcincta TaxID=45464 RepID=A0A2G9UIG8_TELCI|nr:hypothetical protein TELCIR_08112 [Teladorsagia circumcincta]
MVAKIPIKSAAAFTRNQGGQNCASQARNTQISEDEALARALAESMDEVSISPEERDRRLAEQLQAQEYGLVVTYDVCKLFTCDV